jgi:tetratricopeptide (TPR) repeat protein
MMTDRHPKSAGLPRPSDSVLNRERGWFLSLAILLLLPGLLSAGVVRLNNKANSEFRKGRIDKALHLYTEALKPKNLRPRKGPEDSAVVNCNAGTVLASNGVTDKALEAYATAQQAKNPKVRASAHYGAGLVRMQAGQYQEALESFIETLRADPTDKDAKRNIEYIRRKMKNQDKQDQQKSGQNKQKNKEKKSGQQGQSNKDQNGDQDGKKQGQSGEQGEGQPKPADYRQVPGGMTKEQAEQVLNALAAQERQNLDDNKKKMFGTGGYRYVEKDW